MRPSSVDLPLPDGPTTARKSPRGIWSVRGCRIVSGSVPLMTVFETCRSSIIRAVLLHDGLEHGPHVVRDDLRALGCRMNSIGLIQPRVARHALQQKRDQRHM